jgi:ATPases involved in chromosome partitioning
MRVITLANHKGGCQKTTTAFNLAVILAANGNRVLAVDMDPQGNLSAALGVDLDQCEVSHLTSHRMMLNESADYSSYLVKCRHRLDLIPACLDNDAESMIEGTSILRELLLKNKLKAAKLHYDYCVIDTPPTLRLSTTNALACSDLAIIPIDGSKFALQGLNQLVRTIAKIRMSFSPDLLLMALSSRFVARQKLDVMVRQQIIDRFTTGLVFRTTIPRATGVEQAVAMEQAITEAAPESPASFAFRKLVQEIEEVFEDEQKERQAARTVTT